MNFENTISVIIPVHNAAPFVTKAVESALGQPETSEVILIEDASSDNSLEVCKELVEKYEKVKLYQHEGISNKGAGLSRNLGIEKASGNYIAFLDADDYFLPDRFRAERSIFKSDATVDGVYGAMGFHYYSVEGEKKYKEKGYAELTTIAGKIAGKELCFSLLYLHPGYNGHFHLNTLTIKKELFNGKTEFFNAFPMHEDTAFLMQLSINCRLEPGINDEPVAMYGVHEKNRIINNDPKKGSHIKYWKYLYDWSMHAKNGEPFQKVFQAFLMQERLLLSGKFTGFFKIVLYSLCNPLFLRKPVFFRPSALHVFGKYLGWYCINFKEQIQQKYFHDNVNKTIFEEYIGKL